MEYDATLKQLVASSAPRLLQALAGGPIVQWLNIELPRVSAPRMDMLCRRADGCLVNIEFQTTNDADMAEREGVYYLETYRALKKYPIPVVLYLGKEPMRMRDSIDTEHMKFHMRLIDIREFDGDDLAEHGDLGDAIISILANVRNERAAVTRVLERIATLKGRERKVAAEQFTILAALRDLEIEVIEEARRMPVIIDLMENRVVREIYERATAEGEAKGKAEGKAEGERSMLIRQLEKRFGKLSPDALSRIDHADLATIEEWGLRLLDAASLEEALS
jgi:predicted transposase YdaD